MILPDYQALLEAAVERLAEGCSSPEDVAAKLEKAGIRGTPKEPSSCPIANYVREEFRNLPCQDPAAGEKFISIPEASAWVDTPYVLARFITRFDDGEFRVLAGEMPEGEFV